MTPEGIMKLLIADAKAFGEDAFAISCSEEIRRLRDVLQTISDMSPFDGEPPDDDNTDDTDIAFADGAHFGRWQSACVARAALGTTEVNDKIVQLPAPPTTEPKP